MRPTDPPSPGAPREPAGGAPDPTLAPQQADLPWPWNRVLALASQAIGVSEPNPRVGCVLTDAQGRVIGEGHTQAIGGPHAEVMALRDARQRGASLVGATAWVSLEPCAHHGRTPPCCEALIEAGIGRVHLATVDPFPAVSGQGIGRLRAAGVEVEPCTDDAVLEAAMALNIGFFSRLVRGRPWVRMKVAASLDGRTALPDGRSQWITGPAARHDGHAWRRRATAVLTGVGTAVADDPRLDVRGWPSPVQPVRVVVDSRLELPPGARLLEPPGRVWIAHAENPAPDRLAAAAALQARGAELLPLPTHAGGKTDLHALLQALGSRAVNELHLEAGEKLNGSWLRAGLVDELLLYQAPRLIGEGAGLAAIGTLGALDDAPAFRRIEVRSVGDDLRQRLVRAGADGAMRRALGLPRG